MYFHSLGGVYHLLITCAEALEPFSGCISLYKDNPTLLGSCYNFPTFCSKTFTVLRSRCLTWFDHGMIFKYCVTFCRSKFSLCSPPLTVHLIIVCKPEKFGQIKFSQHQPSGALWYAYFTYVCQPHHDSEMVAPI